MMIYNASYPPPTRLLTQQQAVLANYPGLRCDEHGSLVQMSNGNNGDSCHHTMFFLCMISILREFKVSDAVQFTYYDEDGMPRRHPTRPSNDFSRDQFTAMLAYDITSHGGGKNVVGHIHYFTEQFYRKIMKRFGIFMNTHTSGGEKKQWWNRDIMDPATIGMFHRAYCNGDKLRRPLTVLLGDFHVLTSIIFRFWKVRNDPSSTADENLMLHLMTAKIKHPTFISNFAWKYYFKNRPFGWRHAVKDFWDRGGTYFPGMVPLTIRAVELLDPSLKEE